MRTALPADYKQFVGTYGGGIFDDTIRLLVPDSAYSERPARAERERYEILADLSESEEKPAGLLEAGGRLPPWAFEVGTGAFLYWLARPGQQPDQWTLLYSEGSGPLWEHHGTGCLAFSPAVLTGTAETVYSGCLYDVLKPTEHRFATADQLLGTFRR